MCATTNATTLAALQTAVLAGVKIDSPDKTTNNSMLHLIDQITDFVKDSENHDQDTLEEFKKFEGFVSEMRRQLTTNVAAAKKGALAEERQAISARKSEEKKQEKAVAAAARKERSANKVARKNALRSILNKYVKKPKSPLSGKTDDQVTKWGWRGLGLNYEHTQKAARKAAREAKKLQKDTEAEERRLANAGKPKNGDFARFCTWTSKEGRVTDEDIHSEGVDTKREYNTIVWREGFKGLEVEFDWTNWDDFKKSRDAPWNQNV
jgi:uncharacterized protein (UPF0128 family)